MYNRDSNTMNPTQRLEVLKKEMEHLAMEKELLKAETRNLQMEKEVAKLRQGILALQSGNNPHRTDDASTKSESIKEIVVTPRRIVKKNMNKVPVAPAFSPPRFIQRFDEPTEEKPPILTPAARLVMASMDAKKISRTETKQQKASFLERKTTRPETERSFTIDNRLSQSTIVNTDLNQNSQRSQSTKAQKSDLEKFDSGSSTLESFVTRETRTVNPVKTEQKQEICNPIVLTPTARLIKADMEAKKVVTQTAKQVVTQTAKKVVTQIAKQVVTQTAKQVVTQTSERDIAKGTSVKKLVESTVSSEKQQETLPVILTPLAKAVKGNLELRRSVDAKNQAKQSNVTEIPTEKPSSPSKIIQVTKSQSKSSTSPPETKLTPTGRAVQESMEANKVVQKKRTTKTIKSVKTPEPELKHISSSVLPDTPKSKGVHFAKVEAINLVKPFTSAKILTPEDVRGIIKPARLTRRALHPERDTPPSRLTRKSSGYISNTKFDKELDSVEEDDESQFSESSAAGSSIIYTKVSSVVSRGRKRQIETDSSNDDDVHSEIEETIVTPQLSKKRKTYVTTPHPVKAKRRTLKASDKNDDADDDTSDTFLPETPKLKTSKNVLKKKQKVKRSKSDESNEESDQIDESVVSTPTRKRQVSLLSKTSTEDVNEESDDSVKSTPSKRRRSSTLPRAKSGRVKMSEESHEESEDSTIGTPSKRRRSSILSTSKSVSSKCSNMPDIPEDEAVLTPVQRAIMAKMKTSQEDKSSKTSKSEIKEEKCSTSKTVSKDVVEDRSLQHGKKKTGKAKVESKPEDSKPNLTPAARQVLAKMQDRQSGKKTIVKEPVSDEYESEALDKSKRRSKRK